MVYAFLIYAAQIWIGIGMWKERNYTQKEAAIGPFLTPTLIKNDFKVWLLNSNFKPIKTTRTQINIFCKLNWINHLQSARRKVNFSFFRICKRPPWRTRTCWGFTLKICMITWWVKSDNACRAKSTPTSSSGKPCFLFKVWIISQPCILESVNRLRNRPFCYRFTI